MTDLIRECLLDMPLAPSALAPAADE